MIANPSWLRNVVTFFGRRSARSRPRSRRASIRTVRPCLEPLEDRTLPAPIPPLPPILWINPLGGDWDNAFNWLGGKVPGPNDQAVINLPGTFTVTHNYAIADSVASLTSNQTLDLGAGSLSIAGASSINTLDLTGGTLGGPGDVTVTGPFAWTSGTLSGGGQFNAQGGLTIDSTGYVTLDGRTIYNSGAATWIKGDVHALGSATFDNLAGATFTDQCGCKFQPLFLNAGTFTKVGAATARLDTLDNSGTVTLSGGTLKLLNFSQTNGTTDLAGNTLIADSTNWSGGTITGSGGLFDASTSLTIDGSSPLTLDGITVDNRGSATWLAGDIGTVNGSIFNNLTGASFAAQSDATFNTTFNNAGTFTLAGNAVTNIDTLNNSGTVLLQSGTLNLGAYNQTGGAANLGGNTLIATNATWTGGTIDGGGQLDATNSLLLAGAAPKILDGVAINNFGTATWTTGNIDTVSGSTFNNLNGASFTAQSDAAFNTTFNNAGSFTLNGNAVTTIDTFDNRGTVALQSGTLSDTGYAQTAGTTYLLGNTINALNPVQIGGGALFGSGTINADLVNGGNVSPGGFGTLTVNGNYTQTSAGSLSIAIGGTDPTQMDQLQVNGTASFGGKLGVGFVNGFTPGTQNSFTVAIAGTVAKPFDAVTISNPGNQVNMEVIYSPGAVVVAPVPPPPPADQNGNPPPSGSILPSSFFQGGTVALSDLLVPHVSEELMRNLAVGRSGAGSASAEGGWAESYAKGDRTSTAADFRHAASSASMDESGADDDLLAALLSAGNELDRIMDTELLLGFDIGAGLLTGFRPKADILPQKGSRIASVATLLPGESSDETVAAPDGGGDEDLPLREFLIDPLRQVAPSPAAVNPAAAEAGNEPSAAIDPVPRPAELPAATAVTWGLLLLGATVAANRPPCRRRGDVERTHQSIPR